MDKHPKSGKLYTEYYVVCGICNTEMPAGAQSHDLAALYLKRAGWTKTKENGWTCSDCTSPKTPKPNIWIGE